MPLLHLRHDAISRNRHNLRMRLSQRVIAREWLLLLLLLALGFVSTFLRFYAGQPTFSYWDSTRGETIFTYGGYAKSVLLLIRALGHPYDRLQTWNAVLSPYLVTQLIRSIIWACQTLRKDPKAT